jgi:hypothetical protein
MNGTCVSTWLLFIHYRKSITGITAQENQYNIFIFWAKASPLTFRYMWYEFKCVIYTHRIGRKPGKWEKRKRKKTTRNCIRQRSSWKTINFLKAITSNQYTFILYLIFFCVAFHFWSLVHENSFGFLRDLNVESAGKFKLILWFNAFW